MDLRIVHHVCSILLLATAICFLIAFFFNQRQATECGILRCHVSYVNASPDFSLVIQSGHRTNGCRLTKCQQDIEIITKSESRLSLSVIYSREMITVMERLVQDLIDNPNKTTKLVHNGQLKAHLSFDFTVIENDRCK